MAILGMFVFVGALAVASATIWLSLAPQWNRVVRLMTGHVETGFAPLATLAVAERRIALRRWAAQSGPVTIPSARAA